MRSTRLRWLVTAFTTAFIVALIGSATIQAAEEPAPAPPQPAAQTYWQANGCAAPVSGSAYIKSMKRGYRFSSRGGNYWASKVTTRRVNYLRSLRRCSPTRESARTRLGWTQRRVKRHRFHRYINQITPYGEWAIPTPIVMCESGGNYRAKNPDSTASGAYQALTSTWLAFGGGRYASQARYAPPWAQHIVGSRIWRGQGRRAWVC